MDPCHSVSPRSPAYTSAVTVAHLIRNIEQLKNKDKLISQLEKDLGQQWVAAHLAALERESSEGVRGPSRPFSVLPEDSYDPNPFTSTPTSTPTTGGVEEARSSNSEGYISGKQDLPKKLKDCKDRNKELVERCRAYLQRNKELTAQNRAYKDSSEKVLQENKKMQELLEHSKLQVLQLTRNLNESLAQKTSMEQQIDRVDEIRKEMMEDKKTISALKQACSDKDRRIELIQHRKKKRRLAGSAEKNMGMKETFFGYEEDNRSVDSEHSISSLSHSTFSDEDVWDEVLTREETERCYQRLMMEHLQLQKSHAQLQAQSEHSQDPQREALIKVALQNDLFNAQCRIEKLEKLINEIGEGEVITLLKERESIIASSKEYLEKAQFWETEGHRTQHKLNKALERCEDLEFQLIEMEQGDDYKQSSTCEDGTHNCLTEDQLERLAEIDHQLHVAVQEMEELRKELVILLKGKGREGDAILKRLDRIKDDEKKRAESMETIATELQKKVISLQKEKDALHDSINQKGQKQGKGDNASSMVAARERQENLELKEEIAQLSSSESKLLVERMHLYEQLEDWKTQYEYLKQQLDIITKAQSQHTQSPQKPDASEDVSSSRNSSPLSSRLTRKNSKDRKSRSSSTDDPTEIKRRRSSKDAPQFEDVNMKSFRGFGDVTMSKQDHLEAGIGDTQIVGDSIEELQTKMMAKDIELKKLKEENFNLQDQLRQCSLEKSVEAEADQQILMDKLEVLEAEVGHLRKENAALAQKLGQRLEDFHDSHEELNPRVTELEDYCEDLQERLRASETTERQMRDKLRFVEQSFYDVENSEMVVREKYENLLARDAEAKKQILELQRTGRELRDIVLDKDFVEQALRDKVDFLQKAEAASSKRIDELEAIERELREQLEQQTEPRDGCHREQHKIQELKHQMTFLETDNKALSARVAELEENEEILRENWRRVADEDFNRTQCLEEKVKMLEVLNRDLKSRLTDAQEYYIIGTVPETKNSLASELGHSQAKAFRRAATFDDDDDDNDDAEDDLGGSAGSDWTDSSGADVEKKKLREKLRQLEKQLSSVSEEKNTKIESLQEKIVSLKENEVKLSETISELEMTERELRAKLALYESSEVTVEKMLKYQSRIEELRTSQESLLDQIESMENQEMTLQEKMQEMERTLRGKIVILEVEMRNFKQKEMKDAARIRELEKQDKELTEKVAQQAEKENGLYVKISSLMDELKVTKEELNTAKTTLLEKDDKVRRANLLEIKYTEKEMENGKKISALSTKLRHKEEELRQKEAAHEEKVASLQQEISDKNAEGTQQISGLEQRFAQKEKDLQAVISSLSENVKELTGEKEKYALQVRDLTNRITELTDKDIQYNKELEILRLEVSSVNVSEKEHEEKMSSLQNSLQREKQRAVEAENKITSLEKELTTERENVLKIESKIVNLKNDIGEKMKNMELSFAEKEREFEKEKHSLQNELKVKDEQVRELEKELNDKLDLVSKLQGECDELKSKAAFNEHETMEKLADLGKILAEKDESLDECQKCLIGKEREFGEQKRFWEAENNALKEEYDKMLSSVKEDQNVIQNELRNRIEFLNMQLLQEVAAKEKDQSLIEKSENREKNLLSEVNELKKEVENFRQVEVKLKNQITEQDDALEKLKKEFTNSQSELQNLRLELSHMDNVVKETQEEKDKLLKEKDLEIGKLLEEMTQKEVNVQELMQKSELFMRMSLQEQQHKENELESARKELFVLLSKHDSQKNESDVQIQDLHSQIEILHQDKNILSQRLVSMTSEVQENKKEIQRLTMENEASFSEIGLLQKQIDDKNNEIIKQSKDQSGTQFLISAKQGELDQARRELEKCLQEIEEFKNNVKDKENKLSQQEQKHYEIAAKLDEQLKDQNIEYKELESKVAHTELKLVEAENRYRELKAKCASLQLQLQESFAQAQQAETLIREKDEKCQQLEQKITTIEKDFEITSTQIHEAEQIIMMKDKEFKQLESKLQAAIKECGELRSSLVQKEDEQKHTYGKFVSLERENKQLKSESHELHEEFSKTQTQQQGAQSKVDSLKLQLLTLEDSHEQTQSLLKMSEKKLKDMTSQYENMELQLKVSNNQKSDSDMKYDALQSDVKSREEKYKNLEAKQKHREEKVMELEKSNEAKDSIIQNLQMKLKEDNQQFAEIESNLKQAESNYKSKCMHIGILESKLHDSERELRTSEEVNGELKEKLKSAEDTIVENRHHIEEFTVKVSILEKALKEMESLCRDSQSDLSSLEKKYLETQIHCENLKSKLTCFQEKAEQSQALSDRSDEKLGELGSVIEQTRTEMSSVQSQLEHSQKCLTSNKEELKLSREQVNSLEQKLNEIAVENKILTERNTELNQALHDKETLFNNILSELEIMKQQGEDHRLQMLKAVQSNESADAERNESEQRYSNTVAELNNVHKNLDTITSEYQDKCVQLESLCQKLQEEVDAKSLDLETLRTSESELMSSTTQLKHDNTSLKAKLDAAESNLHSSETELTELIEMNQSLSGRLYQLEKNLGNTSPQVTLLEQMLSSLQSEREEMIVHLKQQEADNRKLLDEAKVAENFKRDFDKSKTHYEISMSDMINRNEINEKALQEIQIELVNKNDRIASLEQELQSLKSLCVKNGSLKPKALGLEVGRDKMPDHTEEENILTAEIVKESDMCISVTSELQTKPPLQARSNVSTVLSEKLPDSEDHLSETALKVDKLMIEIEAYKRADFANQEKVFILEKTLKEMREKEVKMSERMHELEEKEKELLEQIADIEANVIVPLETENQELKDEVNVVKQERDDAQARGSKWGPEDEDQQDMETVHKSLEDALILRDELEKKVEILCEDISRLEQEKESFMRKIVDLEAGEAEHKEKVESLEDEVERLHALEKTTSVIEETETCLMDRVLDLEDKEQQLLAELAQIKNKPSQSSSVQTEEQSSHESLLEKLKYLEQKNAVLQDAEERYMEKIVELEEIQHKLLSERLGIKPSSEESVYDNNRSSAEANNLTLNSAINLKNIPHSDEKSQTFTSLSMETTDLRFPSEQTVDLINVDTSHIHELENSIKNLAAECEEKTSKIKYLEEKCELLRDSEAKLMEKLLESEESAENRNANRSQSFDEDSELKKKIEILSEENEFLAESVESFKQLYKEEKAKNNDLHDRFMEDNSTVQELHDTRAELQDTQQMVKEIQSEYEEQLAEREYHENQLKDKLALNQQKERDLQVQILSLQQYAEECQKKLTAVIHDGSDHKELVKLMEEEKNESLQKLEAELRSYYSQLEHELQAHIHLLQTQQEEQHVSQMELEIEHQNQLKNIRDNLQELQKQVDTSTQRELDLQAQIRALRQREQDLLSQTEGLQKLLEKAEAELREPCMHPREESIHSDSGMSADDQHARYFGSEKSSSGDQNLPPDSPLTQKLFSSTLTLNLAQPPSSVSRKTIDGPDETQTTATEPVPPPRRLKSRQISIDSIAQEELHFLVEELQTRESALKKRLRELEALADSDLSQRIEELELENQTLQRKLNYAESEICRLHSELDSSEQESGKPADSEVINDISSITTVNIESKNELDRRIPPILSSSHNMLGKPEDVLHKRIKELENLDKHYKNQLSELERDREMLHEIARKDKSTIHDLNVKIRELQFSERSLKEQVNSLETSESSLFTKCENLEAVKVKLEDRVHELSVHERRLRELVRKLKLNEEHWLSKSGGMETAVAELSANEQQLKRLLQDVEMQKGGLSERAEYLEARIRELENAEATLLQRLRNYENAEANLQNKLIQVENSEAAAFSKVSELDVINVDLSRRLQKSLEENLVLTQHISQLRGQINELDRNLLSSKDSELSNKQHVDSLQKNESSLQKKVREYELREIDSQARVRELEQTNDILTDKLATLQKSENRLKLRVQELEVVVGQATGNLPLTQKPDVPQKLEDCQRLNVLLQNQLEILHRQLRDAPNITQTKLASRTNDGRRVSMMVDDYRQLQTKSALLEETIYQMEEVERLNGELSETIQQLRKGKGASSHEVEIEVLKRRLVSYKTFINKLKSSLSEGQATSLWDPELDSGLQGDTLPARQLHGLESERVLQSVRGLHEGKADTSSIGGAQQYGLIAEKDTAVQTKATPDLLPQPANADTDDNSSIKSEHASSREESHWRAIEARKPRLVASSRGGAVTTLEAEAKQGPPDQYIGSKESSPHEVEEVTVGLYLQSESELSSHHRTTQNDTDSSDNPVPPPRRGRAHRAGKSINNKYNYSSGSENSDGMLTENSSPVKSAVATNKKYFVSDKSLPSLANTNTSQEQAQRRAPLTNFGEDSFYLPSSSQEGVDSLEDVEAPPLPFSGPPGTDRLTPSSRSSDGSLEKKDSLDNSTSGMSIRDRIAVIERQFQADKTAGKADDEVVYWKKKASEGLKQAEVLEKETKHLKDDINRLEKELEEKRRYINLFELWLMNLEDLLRNKNKQTDKQLIEQLYQELPRLRGELKHVGYRSEEAAPDPASLKAELEHKNREIVITKHYIEDLTRQLQHCEQECLNIEGMRQNTVDSLRALEQGLVHLQDKEKQLQAVQTELQTLKTQYDEVENYRQQTISLMQPLQAKLARLAKKCQDKDRLLHRLGVELRLCTYRPSSALDDLDHLEQTLDNEEYNKDYPQAIEPSQQRPELHRSHSHSSSSDKLDVNYPYSDTDSGPGSFSKRKHPSQYVSSRPRSADVLGSKPRVQRGTHAHPRSVLGTGRPGAQLQVIKPMVTQGQFIAIADYDPTMFSQSGRPGLELEIREGEIVKVAGPMDKTGYYEAEVNGRIGLVPANYLQPLFGCSQQTNYSSFPWPSQAYHDGNTEQAACIHRKLHEEPVPNLRDGQSVQKTGKTGSPVGARTARVTHGSSPDPPTNLHVSGIVNENSIVLSWLPPKLDNKGNNKGMKMLGFVVFLNYQEHGQIPDPRVCEVVMENLNLDQPHHLAVQTVCAGGLVSPKAELVFEGIVRMSQSHQNAERSPGHKDLDTDLSSILSSVHYKRGHRKTVIALYDYNPEQQSPLDYTSYELAFQAGQVIHVYGEPRPDGFFHGEIEGQRGLVPACFVEDKSQVMLSQNLQLSEEQHTSQS